MMGMKARVFGPLHDVSLDDLVPRDTFYRYVEAKLDLQSRVNSSITVKSRNALPSAKASSTKS
jgi:hypothetical protein